MFIIVKYLIRGDYPEDYIFTREDSCHNTYTGKQMGIEPLYADQESAQSDCNQLNHRNPSGYYGVMYV